MLKISSTSKECPRLILSWSMRIVRRLFHSTQLTRLKLKAIRSLQLERSSKEPLGALFFCHERLRNKESTTSILEVLSLKSPHRKIIPRKMSSLRPGSRSWSASSIWRNWLAIPSSNKSTSKYQSSRIKRRSRLSSSKYSNRRSCLSISLNYSKMRICWRRSTRLWHLKMLHHNLIEAKQLSNMEIWLWANSIRSITIRMSSTTLASPMVCLLWIRSINSEERPKTGPLISTWPKITILIE